MNRQNTGPKRGRGERNSPVTDAESEDGEKRKVGNLPHLRGDESVDGVDPGLPVEEGREKKSTDDDRRDRGRVTP